MFSNEELQKIQQFKNDAMIALKSTLDHVESISKGAPVRVEYLRLSRESDEITSLLAREHNAQDIMIQALARRGR